jgi:orotate phosphoribosyltransferase
LDKLLADVLGEEKDGVTAGEVILKALRAKAAKGDVRAAEVLLDRAYGKAKQVMDMNVSGQIHPLVIQPVKVKDVTGQ